MKVLRGAEAALFHLAIAEFGVFRRGCIEETNL